MISFQLRVDNIEVRPIAGPQIDDDSLEIVKWQDNGHCYSVAYFHKNKEGYYLTFCGDRPFNLSQDEKRVFWAVARTAQNYLDSPEEFR